MSTVITQGLKSSGWKVVDVVFNQWIKNRESDLKPGLKPEPTIKILIFLALLDAQKACTYEEIREIFIRKGIIVGVIPDNTLRTSISNLAKTLNKYNHFLEVKSFRGKFQLISRTPTADISMSQQSPVILLFESPAIKAEDIAYELIAKARLPFYALYFLEWSARWWEIFSNSESQIRVQYEVEAWGKLGIKDRLLNNSNQLICFVSLAPGEGLAEIELLKKILCENPDKTLHYIAIDSSKRLLREHLNLLKEILAAEIKDKRIMCVGVIADIFCGLCDTINRVRRELVVKKIIKQENDFLPVSSSLMVTYLGNCLGNYYQDQETEIFSIIYSTFPHRPLEFLVGVSVMRHVPDEYKRNWDDFLLQTPKHLLETNKLLVSSRKVDSKDLPEFNLPNTGDNERCPSVIPETYRARHHTEGQIYRFYYRLQYDLNLCPNLKKDLRPLPKGSLILLYNIVKYNMQTLVDGIEACGLFKIKYDEGYHQLIDTPNGKREYAVFSAFLKK